MDKLFHLQFRKNRNFSLLANRLAYEQPVAGTPAEGGGENDPSSKEGGEKRIQDLMSKADRAENEKKLLAEENEKLKKQLEENSTTALATEKRLNQFEIKTALKEKLLGKEHLISILEKIKEPEKLEEIDGVIKSAEEIFENTKKSVEENLYKDLKIPGYTPSLKQDDPVAKLLQEGSKSGLAKALELRRKS